MGLAPAPLQVAPRSTTLERLPGLELAQAVLEPNGTCPPPSPGSRDHLAHLLRQPAPGRVRAGAIALADPTSSALLHQFNIQLRRRPGLDRSLGHRRVTQSTLLSMLRGMLPSAVCGPTSIDCPPGLRPERRGRSRGRPAHLSLRRKPSAPPDGFDAIEAAGVDGVEPGRVDDQVEFVLSRRGPDALGRDLLDLGVSTIETSSTLGWL